MGPSAAEAIVVDVRNRLRARVVEPEVVVDSIRTQLLARLVEKSATLATAAAGPTVILVTGVNGSGKTTSIAKLANRFVNNASLPARTQTRSTAWMRFWHRFFFGVGSTSPWPTGL